VTGCVGAHEAGRAAERMRRRSLAGLCVALVPLTLWAVASGTAPVGVGDVIDAIVAFDGSREHLVVTTLRLPRVLAGLLAGGALAVAGAIMQAVTGNPLAAPDLLGVNAGAAAAVVTALSLLGVGSQNALVWYAFAGAAIAAAIVFMLGSFGRSGATPLKLVLAGAVLTACLSSLTTAMLIYDKATLDTMRLWTAGSLAGRSMADIGAVAPYILTGLAAALVFRRHLTTLSLGAEAARSLGQNPLLWRGLAAVLVVLLAGGAVALTGPIGFVGLVVPHIARMTAGVDYRWIIPFSAAGGAGLVVLADTLGRSLFASQSFPVGVSLALIGAPFFIWLARRFRGHGR
jgi:iron complex transport system permease protein